MAARIATFFSSRFMYQRPASTPPDRNTADRMPPSPTFERAATMSHIAAPEYTKHA